MTISCTSSKDTSQNDFGLVDEQQKEFKMVLKEQKAHERTVVGVQFFRDRRTGQLSLVSIGHDSLKLWSVITFDDEIELTQLKEAKRWNCGVQSYAMAEHGNEFFVVGTESVLHIVGFGALEMDGAVSKVQRGMMEIWFVQVTSTPGHFLTVNFQADQLQILNTRGEVLNAVPFEKAKQISAIIYGFQFTAIGNSHGIISVANSSTLQTLYSIEAHSMRVRCLTFIADDGKLLSGSDDKTVKLFALGETRAQLLRIFCGHKGIVTGLAVCRASEGQRFASCGTDNCVIVWNTQSGDKSHVFGECTGTANDVPRCVAFTPNGRFLVAGSEDANILAFRVPQPKNYVEQLPLELENGTNGDGLAMDEWEREGSPIAEFNDSTLHPSADYVDAFEGQPPQHRQLGTTPSGEDTPNGSEMADDGGQTQSSSQQNTPADGGERRRPPQGEEGEIDPEEVERRELEMELGID
uniref:WD_REPEATS_REGION domain-containing protein n=1 Tax=Globodera rostochiensis TaxID=31243 RepID=A0A914H2U1_GLORO